MALKIAPGPVKRMKPVSDNRAGHPAELFQLPDADGKLHRLEDYRGRWLLLVFHRHLG